MYNRPYVIEKTHLILFIAIPYSFQLFLSFLISLVRVRQMQLHLCNHEDKRNWMMNNLKELTISIAFILFIIWLFLRIQANNPNEIIDAHVIIFGFSCMLLVTGTLFTNIYLFYTLSDIGN
jgi:hypothetical protein